MSPPPAIRPLLKGDLDAVAAIERASSPSAWSRASFHQELAHTHSLALVATELTHSPIVGFVIGWIVAGELEVLNLAVEAQARRRGVGGSLLRALIERARLQGCVVARLEVRFSNHPAIAMYKREGFEEVGRRPQYYQDNGEDAVLMELSLRI